jgi:carbonic anhydrase/acetyltransferase-like protein (isoleucine patch superfamily)
MSSTVVRLSRSLIGLHQRGQRLASSSSSSSGVDGTSSSSSPPSSVSEGPPDHYVWSLEGVGAPRIAPDVFVAPGTSILGRVTIGAKSSIWYNCVLRGDVQQISIGEETNIQDGSVIHVARNNAKGVELPTVIGNQVTVGHMVLLHACTLEDLSFVGMKSTVMDGAVVKSGAMVAAGSLVTPGKVIPSGQLWGGQPARFMRDMTEKEKLFLPVSATKYAELGLMHRKHLREHKG